MLPAVSKDSPLPFATDGETDDEEVDESEMLCQTRFQVDKLKDVFHRADIDGNGMLKKENFRALLEGRSVHQEDLERFRRWCLKVGVDPQGDFEYIFSFFDRKNSGMVNWKEFAAALEADIRLDLVRQETLRLPASDHDISDIRIRGGFTHVLVVVRVRPLSKNERSIHAKMAKNPNPPKVCVQVSESGDGHHLVGIEKPARAGAVLKSQAKAKRNFFAFDKVFGPSSSTEGIYKSVIVPNRLVDRYLDGISVTVFAYGATGSGKSYTMMGSAYTTKNGEGGCGKALSTPSPGIVQLMLSDVFARQRSERGVQAEFTVSYLEIYNETIQDLLASDDGADKKKKLILCEDPRSHVVDVIGLTKTRVKSTRDVMKLIKAGNKRRVMASTAANEFSSRSHAVLQLHYKRRARLARGGFRNSSSTLTLVDLAGSERASQTQNRGKLLREGANINRSLLALGSCIKALAGRGARKRANRRKSGFARPKFRDSKLTLMLKNSLEGRSVLVMLAMATPSSIQYNDTLNTFKYADRAKSISVTPEQKSNVVWPEIVKPRSGKTKNGENDNGKSPGKEKALRRLKVRYSRVKDGKRELRRTRSAPRDRSRAKEERGLEGCSPPPSKSPSRPKNGDDRSGSSKNDEASGNIEDSSRRSSLRLLKAKRVRASKENHAISKNDRAEKGEGSDETISEAPKKTKNEEDTSVGGDIKQKRKKGNKGNLRDSMDALNAVMATAMKSPLPSTYCNGDAPTSRWIVTADCGAPLSCAGGPMMKYVLPKGDSVDVVGQSGEWLEVRAFVPRALLAPMQAKKKQTTTTQGEVPKSDDAGVAASTRETAASSDSCDSPPRVAIKVRHEVPSDKTSTPSLCDAEEGKGEEGNKKTTTTNAASEDKKLRDKLDSTTSSVVL